MDLRAMLLCSDDRIERVLRRTLGDLEIGIEHCTSSEVALSQLKRMPKAALPRRLWAMCSQIHTNVFRRR